MVKNYGTSCEFTEESFFDSNSPIQSETDSSFSCSDSDEDFNLNLKEERSVYSMKLSNKKVNDFKF